MLSVLRDSEDQPLPSPGPLESGDGYFKTEDLSVGSEVEIEGKVWRTRRDLNSQPLRSKRIALST